MLAERLDRTVAGERVIGHIEVLFDDTFERERVRRLLSVLGRWIRSTSS